MTHEEFAAKHPHTPSPVYVKIDRHSDPVIDRQKETAIDRQPPVPIDRQAPLTYRVQMPKIDVARLNELRPQPKASDNPLETIKTPSDDAADPMEVDRVPMGRTLRKRNEKVAKHMKRRPNEKERESFQKRVFRIPLEKPFEEAYFTHRLWMFFRETKETEEDIRRMFCEARERMKNRITLKKKSDPGKFTIPCGAFQEIIHFCGLFLEELGRDCERPRAADWRAFLSTVGAVCNLQTNQLCLTLIDPHVHYNPIPVKKPQTSSRSINDLGIIAACHCGADAHQKSTDAPKEESVDSSPEGLENDYYNPTMAAHTRHTMHTEEYDEDYVEERDIKYKAVLDEEDRLLKHSS
ncbi:hypothetical protein F2Q69_00058797 [Brassica cretica]|uniref:Uncharacterized protein n=1 Tax=Brassica cretica TaxID=69181 RepID=A0A8S9RCB6_BRACR|nr:hypothetical protein F2Q69_00058797 [Brassica cretica]